MASFTRIAEEIGVGRVMYSRSPGAPMQSAVQIAQGPSPANGTFPLRMDYPARVNSIRPGGELHPSRVSFAWPGELRPASGAVHPGHVVRTFRPAVHPFRDSGPDRPAVVSPAP